MVTPVARKRLRFLVPVSLLALVGGLTAHALTAPPDEPPVMLGASAGLDGGLARIQGVIPTEVDGWKPPSASADLPALTGEEIHRVRILLELTAMDEGGLVFDPSQYPVRALGAGQWEPVWSSPGTATARQGESIDAVLVFELPDRAVDLRLELPGSPGLSLGTGHHRDRG